MIDLEEDQELDVSMMNQQDRLEYERLFGNAFSQLPGKGQGSSEDDDGEDDEEEEVIEPIYRLRLLEDPEEPVGTAQCIHTSYTKWVKVPTEDEKDYLARIKAIT